MTAPTPDTSWTGDRFVPDGVVDVELDADLPEGFDPDELDADEG